VSLLEFRSAQKWYRMGSVTNRALCGINLHIGEGEFVAIWGPSGSGKSTLCNLAGLLDECNEGSMLFRGVETSTLTDNQRSELRNYHIGFVFQSFNLVPVFTALENVLLPLQLRGLTGKDSRDKALDLLATLGLETHARHRPDELSGGQQQRVAIARALIGDPSLIIADEPTANLDTENARSIIAIMRDKNRQNGTTFLFSTHDERLLDQVERKVHLRDGLVVADDMHTRLR
jgi:putative ABC transport system ATP-binding protein